MLRTLIHRGLIVTLAAGVLCFLAGNLAQAARGHSKTPMVCGEDEKYCEHRVATFCENDACSSVRVEGECVAKDKDCGSFWCGNRQCQTSWLITRDVCCVYYPESNAPEYTCTASELSCRGNSAQLTIRPTLASSELQPVN